MYDADDQLIPRKASPMYWLHIPKCGTSFYNTLVQMPGNCPGMPENLSATTAGFTYSGWNFIEMNPGSFPFAGANFTVWSCPKSFVSPPSYVDLDICRIM